MRTNLIPRLGAGLALLLCTLGLLFLGGRSTPGAAQGTKIQLEFQVRLPDPGYADGYAANRVLSGVKEKVLRTLLNDLQHNMDQFHVRTAPTGPGDPGTVLDQSKTLAELGLIDGTRIIISQ